MGLNRTPGPSLERLGERALLLRPVDQSSVRAIAHALLADPRAGWLEDVVPGDRSLLVVFDGTDRGERSARRRIADAVHATSSSSAVAADAADATIAAVTPLLGRHRVIPVNYGGTNGPDLVETADLAGMSPRDLIDRHTGRDHTVLFLGFAPGFAYLGDSEGGLVVPRLAAPRTATRAGSVALAEAYTGIYPANLPGGWRVIGWTPVVLFDPTLDPPTYLLPGDTVRFEPVDAAELSADRYRPDDWAP